MKYTKTIGRKLLALLPQAKAVAVDRNGSAFWYMEIPEKDELRKWWRGGRYSQNLGQFDPPADWRKTLVVKSCKQ